MSWQELFTVPTIIFLVPIVAIIGGCVVSIVKMYFQHHERIAMIAQGMHPDHSLEQIDESDAHSVEQSAPV